MCGVIELEREVGMRRCRTSTDLEKGFANESCPKEVPEGHEEVATADATQVKGCIGPSSQYEDAHKPMPASSAMSSCMLPSD